MSLMQEPVVLVLNSSWQAVNSITPECAFVNLAGDSMCGMVIEGEDQLRIVSWAEWITLPPLTAEFTAHTSRKSIRIPTVVIAVHYSKIPRKRPKLTARSIRDRDGNRCQYSGKILQPDEGNIDHVIPRARGGQTTWENCVLASKEINSKKDDRLPEEAGLRLIATPKAPKVVPSTLLIKNRFGIKDWELFLKQ